MVKKEKTKKKLDPNCLHVIPFGGCGEFGMNVTAYIFMKKLFVVDAGSMFPAPHHLGVHCIIPEFDSLLRKYKGVEAYFITHGHEDHIGSLPFLYKKWPAPIYATRWTVELIKKKFKEFNLHSRDIHLVEPGQVVEARPLKVRYFHVNHSIPDACSLLIKTQNDKYKVFHTGDFKIDPTPVGTHAVDLLELEEIGREGVDLLVTDSTNAHSPGPSPSEASVYKPLEKIILDAPGRVFITTFSSNLWRLKVIIDICIKNKKKLAIFGRGLQNCLQLGIDLNYIDVPSELIVKQSEFLRTDSKKVVCVLSGSQGEPRSVLMRVSEKEHPQIKLNSSDVIIFSARAIPGNEKSINIMCNKILKQGAQIIEAKTHKDIHVSGHGYQEDIKTFIKLLKPTHYLPVHGTYSHLKSNLNISTSLDYSNEEATLIENGDILKLSPSQNEIIGRADIELLYVDNFTFEPMEKSVLNQRLKIGELGLLIVTGAFSKKLKSFVTNPRITLQGFQLPDGLEEESWSQNISYLLEQHIDRWIENNFLNISSLEDEARSWLRRKSQKDFKKKPVVLVNFSFI